MNKSKNEIADFFGLNRSMVTMLFMVILLGLGEKMGERFLPVYIMAIGGSAYVVGFLNAMDNFLSAIYSFIGGFISDRIGYKNALIIFTILSMVGYLVVIVFPFWEAVIFGAVFFISWTALSLPAILSLVSATVRFEKQTMGVTMHSLVRRIPMAIGPVLGGILISFYGIEKGARLAFAVAFVFGIIALWFIWKYIEQKQEPYQPLRIGESFKKMSPELRWLLLSDIFVRFAEQIPYAFVVVWVMDVNKFSAMDFSFLTVVEMVVAILIYIPVAWLSERVANKNIVAITFGFFTLFPFALMLSHTMPMLIFAFVIRGLKEFGEPTRKALIVKLAPEGAKASVYGTYYLLRDIFVSMAALSSAWLWLKSPEVNFITAGCFGMLGTLIFIMYGKDSRS
ncbi:MAG: enterobactin exporter EntS [Spirochaetes bacterium ADurb.Bin218]|jgi:MFS family permease|nr:MFS transporter [Spirochaetota bacterium]OQA98814.1 MAG: enterobactin exporter EntS [Spirochaetes bacterium ADurb.Bin218]HOQ13246.1 MFS transporter [Spirochaetota bacterium]HOV09131.1 MFS transporter [Spirochaetota bacterium]HPX91643.1 MFS transporter [Spirochaetota bacterium]